MPHFENVLKAIGNTPIVKLNRVVKGVSANIYAKLEFMNPGGSVKDRIGWWMIEDAEKRGVLKPGGTIVEGTSGNTGIGLALAAAIKGYKCIFVLPDKMSSEKIRSLRAFGAKVVVTPTAVEPEDPRSYYQVSRRLARETENAIYLNQYDNLSNREAHYQMTGPEIFRQFPEIDVLVGGLGTGGTICGSSRYLKEKKPGFKAIAVDPVGSIVYDYYKHGKALSHAKAYKMEGIGEDFIPKNYDFSVIDDIIQIEDKESFLMTRELLTKEGIYCGVSAGAAVVGALKWAKAQGDAVRGKNILVIIPDSGNRYMSKVFDDDWMREAGFLDQPSMGTVSELLNVVHPRKEGIIMVKQSEKVSAVIELMRDKSISQVPVSDEKGWIKGVATESALLAALYEGRIKPDSAIDQMANPAVEYVTPDDSIEKVQRLLTMGKVALVSDREHTGKLSAIITKIDLLTYLGKRAQ